MDRKFDCVVCGSCTVDVLVRPYPLDVAVGKDQLVRVEPIQATTGGMVSNAGTALSRLGMQTAAFTYLGDDQWADIVRGAYQVEGINTDWMPVCDNAASSVSVVLIDENGARSFIHSQGAPKRIDRKLFLDHKPLFAQSRSMLLGYYPLMPNLLDDLAEVIREIRSLGCLTAMDAAGGGGTMDPLRAILPHLDVYVPSRDEAIQQTGETDPRRMIEVYRSCGAIGLLGVKLGSQGAILSESPNHYIHIDPVPPPGEVVDTTGAGDTFFAGLLCGLLRGMDTEQAGRLAAATGACCVTGMGASQAIANYAEIASLANL